MAPNPEDPPLQAQLTSVWHWQPRRGFPLRRRRLQTLRLGGKKPRRRMVALVNMFRKMKLKLKYICMVRRLKEYYRNLVKDMAEAGAGIEQFQQRLFMESTFAIPVGVTFSSSYPSRFGSDHRQPRTIFM